MRVRLSDRVRERVASIAARGRASELGADTFAKVGDSLSVAEHYLKPIARDLAILGDYTQLRNVLTAYSAESYSRASLATGVGWTSYVVLQAEYANADDCRPHESPLACEYRIMQPSVALILFGSNDVGILSPLQYEYNMRRILDFTIGRGIVPILSTIPPRIGRESEVEAFNVIVVALADEYELPLIHLWRAMMTLSDYGLDEDGVHPTVPPGLFAGAVDFRADNLYYGHVIRNLTTLHMLDAVQRVVARR